MVSLYFICNLFFSITSTMLWLCVPTGYTCALQKDILYQGKMFVSDNWICFHSKVFGRDTKVINQTHVDHEKFRLLTFLRTALNA